MTVRGVDVERRGQIGWIILNDYQESAEASLRDPDYVHPSPGMALALTELEGDPGIRVIVLTGRNDGEFYRVCRLPHYEDAGNRGRLNPIQRKGRLAGASLGALQVMAFMQKPVIARLNGDAIGLGQAFLWGCDMIVARDPLGLRPLCYAVEGPLFAAASESVALLNLGFAPENIKSLLPGQAVTITDGKLEIQQFARSPRRGW